jgi:hypothetical protein
MLDERDADEPIRGQRRCKGFRRVSHGLFLPERDDLSPDEEFWRELRAWLLVLPDGARFTHVTGARLRGWTLPKLPEHPPVFAAVEGDVARPRRPGLISSRLRRTAAQGARRRGLPVDSAEEILLRCARDLGHIDLVILIVSALRADDVDTKAMTLVLGSRRPGVVALRAAWSEARKELQSPGEAILYLFHRAIDVPVAPQVTLCDERGVVLGQADLHLIGTKNVHEYDGAVHRDTLDDLLNHSLTVMHEIDRALGRPHDHRRHERWCRLVENSLYSEVGRERVMNRWHRAMGVVDWSRTT